MILKNECQAPSWIDIDKQVWQKQDTGQASYLRISNGDLNLDTWFNSDWGDLLHDIRGTEQVDHTFVNSEFKSIPGVGSCKQAKRGQKSHFKEFSRDKIFDQALP